MAEPRPQSTTELLALIEKEWQALMRVVDRLTPEQMTTPDAGGWSPKDNLAHLAAWMDYMRGAYIHKLPGAEVMGIDPDKWKQLDEDGENAVLFERYRDLPAAQVLDMLRRAYAEAVADVRTVPFADLLRPLHPEKSAAATGLDAVLGNTSDHFIEHRKTIEKAL
jgi:hypothetical protein